MFWPLWVVAPQIFYTQYNSLNCISGGTSGTGRPQVGLCPIFVVSVLVHDVRRAAAIDPQYGIHNEKYTENRRGRGIFFDSHCRSQVVTEMCVCYTDLFLYLAECTAEEFKCSNGYCIVLSQVCDYFDNCIDLSDEKNCSYPPRKYSASFISNFTYWCVYICNV